MSNLLNFNISEKHYEISLTPTDQNSLNSVVIGGIKYTIGGEQEAVDLFKQKTRGLNLDSMQVSELQNRLSFLENPHTIPQIAKPSKLGMDILIAKQAVDQTVKNKAKVLNELKSTWPIPGSSPTASITERMKELNVPGVRICVINDGKQEWSQGVGELDKPKPMVQAASISKTITALTVMTLIQEGLKTPKNEPLTLDTNIQDILDEELWKSISNGNKGPITIRQLMSHTAGLEEDTREGYKGYHRLEKIKQEIDQLKDQLTDIIKAKKHIGYLESKRDHTGNGSSGRAKKASLNIQIKAHKNRLKELMNKKGREIEQLNHLQSLFKALSEDIVKRTDDQISKLQIELQKLTKNSQASSSNDKKIIEINHKIEILRAARKRASKGEMPSLDEIIKGEGTNSPPVRLATNPDSPFAYSGGGAMILQKVIEIIAATNSSMSKKTYPDIVKEKVFDRLGMKDSGFSPAENRTIQGNGEDGKPLPGKWVQQPELAAAGLWSTPEDLTKIAIGIQKSLLNQKDGIISKDLAFQMINPPNDSIEKIKKQISKLESQMKETEDTHAIEDELDDLRKKLLETQSVGLGVFIDKANEATYFYHSGSNLGFRCLMVANDQGQGAVVMTNSELGDELIPEVIRKVADTYNWKGKDSLNMLPPLHPEVIETSKNGLLVDSKEWAKNYQGKYESDRRKGAIVSIELNEQENKIYFRTPNPKQAPIEIIPVSEHVGIIKEDGRWFPIEFTRNEDQALVLNIHGMKHISLNK